MHGRDVVNGGGGGGGNGSTYKTASGGAEQQWGEPLSDFDEDFWDKISLAGIDIDIDAALWGVDDEHTTVRRRLQGLGSGCPVNLKKYPNATFPDELTRTYLLRLHYVMFKRLTEFKRPNGPIQAPSDQLNVAGRVAE
jgi:hypothetical protein